MEQDLAILMADLSGFTALTEAHGSASAADLIDKYLDIADGCLIGDSKVQERVGDEIMIVSTSADSLLQTALQIGQRAAGEDQFLQLHGGLHFGKVLKRRQSYFGSAINLTARIAAHAKAGTFCCSNEFANALTNKRAYELQFKGKRNFKNIQEEKEVFEISIKGSDSVYIDSVCHMRLLDINKAIPHPSIAQTYFCSAHCLHLYNHNLQPHTN
jgi:adenylate cyclase